MTGIKILIGLIVIGGLGFLAWWGGWIPMPKQPAPVPVQQAATTTKPVTQAEPPPPPLPGMSAATDAGDTAILQDSAAVDAQMKYLTTDTSSVDASMSDKAITQAF